MFQCPLYKLPSQFLRCSQRSANYYCMNSGKRRFSGYDEAIKALSNLHSRPVLQTSPPPKRSSSERLVLMVELLRISGISQGDLEDLRVIHVAGTKGKGSTCALVESLVRESSSVKTGFYSSPHLVSTTERIRINGSPLSQEKFSEYFWDLYKKIEHVPENIFFFKFLTLMAFNVFIKEKVDVAIIEVGIGGEYDCTNVIEKPLITAITNLGLDHTSILGSTIEEIAWHKSGICKANVPVFVASHQPPQALAVIRSRANEKGSPCFVAPEFKDYDWGGKSTPVLGLEGRIQFRNAALALQIAQYFHVSSQSSKTFIPGMPFQPSDSMREGLRKVIWPGRFQTVQLSPDLILHMDAAHTKESMEECVAWVAERIPQQTPFIRVLLFNATKDHDSETMLRNLKENLSFDAIVFCTNVIAPSAEVTDNTYPPDVFQKMRERCMSHRDFWMSLGGDSETVLVIPYIAHALSWILKGKRNLSIHSKYATKESSLCSEPPSPLEGRSEDPMEILITGSLHLVGDVMETLDIHP